MVLWNVPERPAEDCKDSVESLEDSKDYGEDQPEVEKEIKLLVPDVGGKNTDELS